MCGGGHVQCECVRVHCPVSGTAPPTRVCGGLLCGVLRVRVVRVCGVSLVFVGGDSGGVTPGPIPNPEAKPACADGTALGRVWESRSLPALFFFVGWVGDPCSVLCVGLGGGFRPTLLFFLR